MYKLNSSLLPTRFKADNPITLTFRFVLRFPVGRRSPAADFRKGNGHPFNGLGTGSCMYPLSVLLFVLLLYKVTSRCNILFVFTSARKRKNKTSPKAFIFLWKLFVKITKSIFSKNFFVKITKRVCFSKNFLRKFNFNLHLKAFCKNLKPFCKTLKKCSKTLKT